MQHFLRSYIWCASRQGWEAPRPYIFRGTSRVGAPIPALKLLPSGERGKSAPARAKYVCGPLCLKFCMCTGKDRKNIFAVTEVKLSGWLTVLKSQKEIRIVTAERNKRTFSAISEGPTVKTHDRHTWTGWCRSREKRGSCWILSGLAGWIKPTRCTLDKAGGPGEQDQLSAEQF